MQHAYPDTYSTSMSAASFEDEIIPHALHETGFIPSRAATPEPCSPRSQPLDLHLRHESSSSSSQRFDPYSVYNSVSTRRRPRTKDNKRSMNAFLFYRRAFPSMYPVIDMLEKQQGAKSAIIGALWRREPAETKEQFYLMQERAAEEFRVSHGVADTPRSDPIKTLIRRDRARQRRAADDKLSPRSELIVAMWEQNRTSDDIIKAVEEFDLRSGTTKPKAEHTKQSKQKSVVPLANHTNTTVSADALDSPTLVPATPLLQIATSIPDSAPTPPLSESASSPVSSPTICTPIIRTPSPLAVSAGGFYPLPVGAELSAAEVPFVLPPRQFKSDGIVPTHGFNAPVFVQYPEGWSQMAVSAPILPHFQQQQLPPQVEPQWQPKLTVNANTLGYHQQHHQQHHQFQQQFTLYESAPAVGHQFFDPNFHVPAFDGSFTLGGQEDLAGLATYDMTPSFDVLDPYVEMSCVPAF